MPIQRVRRNIIFRRFLHLERPHHIIRTPTSPIPRQGPRFRGEMDRDGCLTLEREACAAISAQSGSHDVVALDGTCWCLDSNIELADLPFPRTAVIFVDSFYDWRNNGNGLDRWVAKFMLVKEHTLGRFRVMTYIEIDEALDGLGLFETAMEWAKFTFSIV